jgi:hypothetical protein
MVILPQIQGKIKADLLGNMKKKWHGMLLLGINALSLHAFHSFNSNARCASKGSSDAAEMQMYRLCHHDKFLSALEGLLLRLFPCNEASIVNIDFTIFHPFAVLCFAVQTRNGRAIPCFVRVLRYPVAEQSQNLFILQALDEFLAQLKCKPKIVCDRGFIGETLIKGFLARNLTFYVRMKAGKTILVSGKKKNLRQLHSLESVGIFYGKELRVVRTSKTQMKRLHAKECWYIITNDMKVSRETILSAYYYRFEIEETFKDMKHLFDATSSWMKREQTLRTLLVFQMIGIWLFWEILPELPKRTVHKKKKLSWLRAAWEALEHEVYQIVFLSHQHHFSSA